MNWKCYTKQTNIDLDINKFVNQLYNLKRKIKNDVRFTESHDEICNDIKKRLDYIHTRMIILDLSFHDSGGFKSVYTNNEVDFVIKIYNNPEHVMDMLCTNGTCLYEKPKHQSKYFIKPFISRVHGVFQVQQKVVIPKNKTLKKLYEEIICNEPQYENILRLENIGIINNKPVVFDYI